MSRRDGKDSLSSFDAALRDAGRPNSGRSNPLRRSRRRMWVVAGVFALAMGGAAVRLADLAAMSAQIEPHAPVVVETENGPPPARREISDRHGLALASRLRVYDLYFDARTLSFPDERFEVAEDLAAAFDDLDRDGLAKRFAARGTSLVRRRLTPRQAQKAHDLGWPGLVLHPRDARVYFADRAVSHALGWVNVDGVGRAGVEGGLETQLNAGGDAVALSLDLRVQLATREALAAAMERTGAKSAAAVVMHPQTGEILAMVSLPDYDPHHRPAPPRGDERPERSPLFNHAVQGLYEFGSVMKLVTWALALSTDVARMSDVFDPPQPFELDGHTIRDDHPNGELSFPMAFAKSSNIIAAKLALAAGRPAQHRLFESLGLHEPTSVELLEAHGAKPGWSAPWGRSTTAAAAYGHGVTMSLLHLTAATASLINGGERVTPTILRQERGPDAVRVDRPRVIGPEVSKRLRELLRLVVTDGTGRQADSPGLEIGGKTGTAIKPNAQGGYDADRVVSSFIAAFPMSAPQAVVAVMLDEPEVFAAGEKRRSAGWTAAPAARDVIERIAPFVGGAALATATISSVSE